MNLEDFIKLLPFNLTESESKHLLCSDMISKTISIDKRQSGLSTIMQILIMFNMLKGGNSVLFVNDFKNGEYFINQLMKLYYSMKPFANFKFQKYSVIGYNSRLDLCLIKNNDQLRGKTFSFAYIDDADLGKYNDIMDICFALRTCPIKINVNIDQPHSSFIKNYIKDNMFSLTDMNLNILREINRV
jgi:hypothetical protein